MLKLLAATVVGGMAESPRKLVHTLEVSCTESSIPHLVASAPAWVTVCKRRLACARGDQIPNGSASVL